MDPNRYSEDDKAKKDAKKKDGKKDKKDKGYFMFEEENSEEEVLVTKENKTPMKLKKHSKPSFKFVKKEKLIKPKEKEKDEKKKDDKDKKKEEKFKGKKKKHGLRGFTSREDVEGICRQIKECPVFGVALADVVKRNPSHDGVLLPAIVRECVDYIEEYGLTCEGIYRISGVKSKVQALKEAYNKGIPVYLKEYEPNIVASLLKQFLRELPEPILTTELMPKFEQASTLKNVKQKVEEFQRLIEKLPVCNRLLLSWTIIHMTHVITREKQNKMSLQNVSIVLSPTMQISHRVLNVFFTFSKILFKDTVIKKYVPPLKPVTSRWSLDLPDSPTSLEEEIKKQELLLEGLHKDLMKVKDTDKEEQLWEVQRVVTGLKRKMKLLNKAQEIGRSPKLHKPVTPQSLDRKLRVKADVQPDRHVKTQAPQPPKAASQSQGTDELTSHRPTTPSREEASESITRVTDKGRTNTATPSKNTLDFGDIEPDSSAQSQRQEREPRRMGEVVGRKDGIEGDTGDTKNKITSKMEGEEQAKMEDTGEASVVKNSGDVERQTDDKEKMEDREDMQQEEEVSEKSADISKDSISSVEEVKTGAVDEGSESKEDIDEDNLDVTIPPDESLSPSSVQSTPTTSHTKGELQSEDIKEVLESKYPESSESSQVESKVVKEEDGSESDVQTSSLKTGTDEHVSEEVGTTVTKQEKDADVDEESPVLDDDSVIKPEQVSVSSTSPRQTTTSHPVDDTNESSAMERVKNESTIHREDKKLPETGEDLVVEKAKHRDSGGGVTPETLAAKLHQLVGEPEEDLNERLMSEFVQDFGIATCESPDQDEEYVKLTEDHQALLLEEEELLAIGDELRQKIEEEQDEIERLREEIMEIQVMREDLYSSEEDNSSSDSSSEASMDGEEQLEELNRLRRENQALETQNTDLTEKIHQEREACIEVKVQIRMVQQKQLETSMHNQLDLLL